MYGNYYGHDVGTGTKTDEHGRFELGPIPPDVTLEVRGDSFVRLDHELAVTPNRDGEASVVLDVARRRHFRVEVAPGTIARHIALLDASGTRLDLYLRRGESVSVSNTAPIEGLSTAVRSVSEDACVLVLLSASYQEIDRADIELGDGVTLLQP